MPFSGAHISFIHLLIHYIFIEFMHYSPKAAQIIWHLVCFAASALSCCLSQIVWGQDWRQAGTERFYLSSGPPTRHRQTGPTRHQWRCSQDTTTCLTGDTEPMCVAEPAHGCPRWETTRHGLRHKLLTCLFSELSCTCSLHGKTQGPLWWLLQAFLYCGW